jgi:hypothetical protein
MKECTCGPGQGCSRLCRGGSKSLTISGVCFTPLSPEFLKPPTSTSTSTSTKNVLVDVLVHVDVAVDGFGIIWLRSGSFEGLATIKHPALPV